VLTNRSATDPAHRFRRGCPFRPALRIHGNTRRVTGGPRSSTRTWVL